jgi:hypothetical protein
VSLIEKPPDKMSFNKTSTHAEFLAESHAKSRHSAKDNSQPTEMSERRTRSILKSGPVSATPSKVFPAVTFSQLVKQPSDPAQPAPNQLVSIS